MNKNTSLSLEILLLNDLLRSNVIDKAIYDKAVQKITTAKNNLSKSTQDTILATA